MNKVVNKSISFSATIKKHKNRSGSASVKTIKTLDYKASGVDIEKGDQFVDWIAAKTSFKTPHSHLIKDSIGGFASLFQLPKGYRQPYLVSCTDGVGTKVKWAAELKMYSGIGQDLVAMCVNDLLCTGADPLFFLDYLAMGRLDLKVAKSFLQSVKDACQKSQLALVGGETAEMPGVYSPGDFDCAGFAVGIVDKRRHLGSHNVKSGDILIGLPSSGFHSNGYSLLRAVYKKEKPQFKKSLMAPTYLYVDCMQKLRALFKINACAHITGSGIENIPRVIPKKLAAWIQPWELPSIYSDVLSKTQMERAKLMTTFNCGIGMVIVVSPKESKKILNWLELYFAHESVVMKPQIIGKVVPRKETRNQDYFLEDQP